MSDNGGRLWRKYSIESDESFTECIERTIDGWKQRALKAEGATGEALELLREVEKRIRAYLEKHP